MKPHTHTVLNVRHEPGMDETALQECSCDPVLDSSLPADTVLINRMRDTDQSAQVTLFVP